MQPTADVVSEQLGSLTDDFVSKVASLGGDDPNLRTGVLKSAIRDVAWSFLEKFPDGQHDIAEMFEIMADHVKQHGLEE